MPPRRLPVAPLEPALTSAPPDFAALVRAFALPGALHTAERWGGGHIHESYRVTLTSLTGGFEALLQRLNVEIFRDPRGLMANVVRVTRHLRARAEAAGEPDLTRRVLEVLPAATGEPWHVDDQGSWWRAYRFIPRTVSLQVVTNHAQAETVATAFGRFQRDLEDLPGPPLVETLPGFHDTPARFARFVDAVRRDPLQRAAAARAEVDGFLALAPLATGLAAPFTAGELPLTITHQDPKANNVLLDEHTGEALAVIDLDTVMPGLALYDFGDLVRTAAWSVAEDAVDFGGATVDPARFAALARGYSAGRGGLLAAERELLVIAGQVLTFECGVRFLTDHLEGDHYFRIHRPGHNLDRCRTQLALVRALGERADELAAGVAELPVRSPVEALP